ncbi:hypothetical protein ACP7H9_00155 [Idiomarina sp. ST20R2A10]|uniref:hypothetical protein n=1 Tax=Idiomarina sp. ST20R2A10 TaxID=3418369 RepID=UPI003EC4AE57
MNKLSNQIPDRLIIESLGRVLNEKPHLRKVFNNENFIEYLFDSLLTVDKKTENGLWHTGMIDESICEICQNF